MIEKFSISLLLQAFNANDDSSLNYFEHVIVLYHFTEETTKKELINIVKKQKYMEPYEAAAGAYIYWKAVKVMDVFELNSDVTFEDNAEVYSRHFTEELDMDRILNKYFPDFILEDEI